MEKFEKARELQRNLKRVQRHIWESLNADDTRRRKIASICFIIDNLKIRVGDEKDPDEADTVGASTLRPEHINFNGDGTVTFNFLGKDSVPHVFTVELPHTVIRNLKEFSANAKSTLFDGISSKHVSEFLDEVMTGLSAKVFRTCYASKAVEMKLKGTGVRIEDPDHWKKFVATMANLEAAVVCNHRRAIPKTWKSSLAKKKVRLKALQVRAKENKDKLKKKILESEEKYAERLRKQQERLETAKEKLETYEQQVALRKKQSKPMHAMRKRIRLQQRTVKRQKQRIKKQRAKHREQMNKLRHRLKNRRKRDKAMTDRLELKIETQMKTRSYNLTTSLKSYVDPKIYYEWGNQVGYDWRKYYPKALQRRFRWVESDSKMSP